MKIISSRQYLFEKEAYKAEEGKETVRIVTDKIIVRAIPHPQNVPDWVGETDLFETAKADGTIVEVELTGATPVFGVSNESKAGISGTATPVAEVATGDMPQQPQQQPQSNGGWGQGPQ